MTPFCTIRWEDRSPASHSVNCSHFRMQLKSPSTPVHLDALYMQINKINSHFWPCYSLCPVTPSTLSLMQLMSGLTHKTQLGTVAGAAKVVAGPASPVGCLVFWWTSCLLHFRAPFISRYRGRWRHPTRPFLFFLPGCWVRSERGSFRVHCVPEPEPFLLMPDSTLWRTK